MANQSLPHIDELRNRVAYDPASGCLTWRERASADFRSVGKISATTRAKQWNNRFSGKPAFSTLAPNGYLVGSYGIGLTLLAHRVAFAIHEGRWPEMIDHINGNRLDNRWENIRETTPGENLRNCCVRSDSVTGRTGVKPNRRKGRGFIANIKVSGRLLHLGSFDTFEEAAASRQTAEKLLGFSRRHGK